LEFKLVSIFFVSGCLLGAAELIAQESRPASSTTVSDTSAAEADTTDVLYMGTLGAIVVTASRTEQRLDRVPAAMTVLTADEIEQMPVENFGQMLRRVPGVNTAQVSAGDISINTRRATGILPSGQLAIVDNRTIYNQFNGQIIWSQLHVAPHEIKQIEVLRGPNSAIWGANAMDGVIHIITKSPREMQGTTFTAGAGEIETFLAGATHAGVRDKLGYKLSGSWYEQGAFERPTGSIPGTEGPANPGGTPYPPYPNEGTRQPKVNARLDYYQDDKTTWSVSGGYESSSALVLTPTGPFFRDDNDSYSAFAKAEWTRQKARATAYMNTQEAEGHQLGVPGRLTIDERIYHIDFSDTRLLGESNLVTYGASARRSQFDGSLIPDAPDRDEFGAFVQDEMEVGDKVLAVFGARVDDIDPMGTAVSPRASLILKPFTGNSFRLSYNRAFRAPTAVENYVFVAAATLIQTPGDTLVFPFAIEGNTDLDEERLDSFEIAWIGKFGHRVETTLTAYYNERRNAMQIVPSEFYSSTNPPPGWALPDSLLDVPPPGGFAGIPSQLQTMNVGQISNRGIEASLAIQARNDLSFHLDYSWQDDPDVEGLTPQTRPNGEEAYPLNIPPKHRFNVGATWENPQFYLNTAVAYQDVAFWGDVLDARFWGPTESFASVNLAAGWRFYGRHAVLSINAQNIFDERVQQHVWGDIISRKIWVHVTYQL
jgi:iron complex outermembrane receptor protein